MSGSITFGKGRDYIEDRDSILFRAECENLAINCLISSEAIRDCFNHGNSKGKGDAFDNNREAINEIAKAKIQSKNFSTEGEIFISRQDCEDFGHEPS